MYILFIIIILFSFHSIYTDVAIFLYIHIKMKIITRDPDDLDATNILIFHHVIICFVVVLFRFSFALTLFLE